MSIQRPPKIDEIVSPPVVGKIYRVPSMRRGDVFVPVFGSPHTDVELNQPILHFHVDIRFLSDDDAKKVGVDISKAVVPERFSGSIRFTVPAIAAHSNEIVTHRSMKCIRECPDYRSPRTAAEGPTTHIMRINVGTIDQAGLIEDQCEDMRISECGKCPHRGTPLGHQPVTNGVVVCPAHLLKWDKATGKMIRKTKKIADGVYDHVG
jgi:hypothetical protein